ncbi:MAG: YidC/Oxa1 family membrane protein insertase [Parcubacteria group bacterium]
MSLLFDALVYKPLYNLLIFIYNTLPFHDFGIAIILVTLIIKFFLVPLSKKQIESQKKMQEMQPKIKEIQEKYKKDKEKQSKALMEFYKTNKTNPFSGCLPTIFQLIFLIAIYRVLFNISNSGLLVDPKELYAFVANPGQINQYFLGLVDLSRTVNLGHLTIGSIAQIILIVLAAVAQYFQMKMIMPPKPAKSSGTPDLASTMSTQMMYLGPLLTLFIGIKFPAGLALYWLVSTIFAIIQQKQLTKKPVEEK